MDIPKLNSSQRAILDLFKYRGTQTIARLADVLGLNVETIREHVRRLAQEGLVRREGTRSEGRGRPEIEYGLTADAERLFPRREPEVLRLLAEYLRREDHQDVLEGFFDEWIDERKSAAAERVAGLFGRDRLDEVADILSELGFMAVVDDEADGPPRLRLCHCPLRSLVDATKMPCRVEIGLVQELLGADLVRETYIPAGDASCSYATPMTEAAAPDHHRERPVSPGRGFDG